MAVSAVDADGDRESKDMERDRNRHPITSFEVRQNRLSLCWGLRGSKEPYLFYQTNRKMSIRAPFFSTLDKSQESAIIKITKDTSTSGRPRLS